jgi:hypothetical protein
VRTVGRWLPAGWLLIALVLLAVDGRLLMLLAWAVPASLLALAGWRAGPLAAAALDA